MERIGHRIKKLRNSVKISQVELARRLSVTQSSISRYESCTGEPDAAFFTSLSKEFPELNVNWLLTGEGPMYQELVSYDLDLSDTLRLPVVAEIAGGEPLEVYDAEPLGWVEVPRSLLGYKPPYFVFRVRGESMEPLILEGDIVICSRCWEGVNLQGRIMAFRTCDGITLKKLVDDHQRRITWLMPLNNEFTPRPFVEDDADVEIIGILDIAIRSFNRRQ